MEKIGCIGCGTMGGAIMKSVAQKFGAEIISVSAAHKENAQAFAKQIGAKAKGNLELVQDSKIIFIAVKPARVIQVLDEIKLALNDEKIIISIAAGITISELECITKNTNSKIMRAMPNLPAIFGEAMTALCPAKNVNENYIELVKEIFCACGKVEIVEEKMMDGITAVSGSGPAYAFIFMEALTDAAVKFGIPRNKAKILVAQTLKGAAVMALEDSRSISELKDAICSPAGTTIEAVATLEKNAFRGTIIDAATSAFLKSIELGK